MRTLAPALDSQSNQFNQLNSCSYVCGSTSSASINPGFYDQNEMKGETGSPGLKGEKGEAGGGYYDPRFGGSGSPGQPGPPVSPQRHLMVVKVLTREVNSCFCLIRVLKETPSLAHQARRGHLVSQAEATMGGQESQGHLDRLGLLEDHTLESPGTHVVSLRHTRTQISQMTSM